MIQNQPLISHQKNHLTPQRDIFPGFPTLQLYINSSLIFPLSKHTQGNRYPLSFTNHSASYTYGGTRIRKSEDIVQIPDFCHLLATQAWANHLASASIKCSSMLIIYMKVIL